MKYIAKKDYTAPIIETYKIKLQHMIATSLNPSSDNPTVIITSDEETHEGYFSARGSDWDED